MQQLDDLDLPRVVGGITFQGEWMSIPGVVAKAAANTFIRYGMTRNVPWKQYQVNGRDLPKMIYEKLP